ncbi:hypothetical protein D018_1583A, partial [Vibrio parahaemolyticus VP2007-007]
MYFSCCSF